MVRAGRDGRAGVCQPTTELNTGALRPWSVPAPDSHVRTSSRRRFGVIFLDDPRISLEVGIRI